MDRAHNIKNNSRKRSSWSEVKRSERCAEWDIMDYANRRTLEGSAIPFLASALPGMDGARNFPDHSPRAGQRPVRTRKDRYTRDVHRRELCTGKKGVLPSAGQSVAKAPRSWQSQTLLVFLSPYVLKARLPMK